MTELGVNVTLTDDTIILGYHEKPLGINSIIVLAKKVIYNAMKSGKNTCSSSKSGN